MNLLINISEKDMRVLNRFKDGYYADNVSKIVINSVIESVKNGVPIPDNVSIYGVPIPDNVSILSVTEFANKCRECGKQYIKRQKGEESDAY